MGYGEPTAAPFAPDAVEAFVGLGRLDEARMLVEQFISPKTVEADLARVYRKLNIRSRAELGRLLGT